MDSSQPSGKREVPRIILPLALIGIGIALILGVISSPSNLLPPNEPGPYLIGNYTVSYNVSEYGRYDAKIRYPALGDGGPDESGAPYPGIVVSSGLYSGEWAVTWISDHLTSHGYVTLGFTPPDPGLGDWTQWAEGFIGGIRELKRQSGQASSPIYGLLDTERFGIIGMSMGGGGSVEAAGTAGSEVDAAVALAPGGYSSDRFAGGNVTSVMKAAANITVPIQLQVGSNDAMVPPQRVLPFYTDLIPDTTVKQYVEVDGGNHIGFINQVFAEVAANIAELPDLEEELGADNPCTIGFAGQRNVSSTYFTSWFQYHLKGIDGYYRYIFGEEAGEQNLSAFEYNLP
jgi:dienelactone hydrolase